MIQLPVPVGMTLCDRFDVNLQNGLVSLVGIFQAKPLSWIREFVVYAGLTDGAGQGIMELAIVQLATNRTIYRHTRFVAFPDRLLIVNIVIPVRRCFFPAPGRLFHTSWN